MISPLSSGAFADVYDLGDDTVVKVFRRIPQTQSPVRHWDDHEFIIRQLFAAEVRAYSLLQSIPTLYDYVPRFLGTVGSAIPDLIPSSPEEPHVTGCAFRLERISGTDIKVAHVAEATRQGIEVVLEQIRDAVGGINVWDSSCFIPGPRTDFVVIDFALWDEWVDVQSYLELNGTLPGGARQSHAARLFLPDASSDDAGGVA